MGDKGQSEGCWVEPVLMASCCGHFQLFRSHSNHLWRISWDCLAFGQSRRKRAFSHLASQPRDFSKRHIILYCHSVSDAGTEAPQSQKKTRLTSPPIVSQLWNSSVEGGHVQEMQFQERRFHFDIEAYIKSNRCGSFAQGGNGWARTCPLSQIPLLNGTVSQWRKATGTGLNHRSWSNDIWRRETFLSNATVSVSVTADIVTKCGCVLAASVCHMAHS